MDRELLKSEAQRERLAEALCTSEILAWQYHDMAQAAGGKAERDLLYARFVQAWTDRDCLLYGIPRENAQFAALAMGKAVRQHDVLESEEISYDDKKWLGVRRDLQEYYARLLTGLGRPPFDAAKLAGYELLRWRGHHERNYSDFRMGTAKLYERLLMSFPGYQCVLDLVDAAIAHDEQRWQQASHLLSSHYRQLLELMQYVIK